MLNRVNFELLAISTTAAELLAISTAAQQDKF